MYPAAFFEVIPQVNAEVREALRTRWPDADLLSEPILQPGSWIGGDRDGNPNVTADVVRLATGSAAYHRAWRTTWPNSPPSSRSCRCRRG